MKQIFTKSFLCFFVTTVLMLYFIPSSDAAFPTYECQDIELEYTIEGEAIVEICPVIGESVLIMKIDATTDGQITVKIPRTVVYSVNQECDSQDYMILLVNDEDTDLTTENTLTSRIVTFGFSQGQNTIEILGSYTLGLPVQAYCGVIYEHDSVFMPPKFQLEHGMKGSVLCNEGLEVIKKPSDNSQSCVKPTTTKKLIERGWEPGNCNSIRAAPNAHFEYCSFIGADFSGKDLQGANLYNTRFEGANLSNVNLQEASIDRTYFVDANLSGADLRGLDITDAIIRNTNITEALVTVTEWGEFDPNDLIGLDTVIDHEIITIPE